LLQFFVGLLQMRPVQLPLMSVMALVVVSSLRSRQTPLPAAFDGRVGIMLLSLWA
jgi:hypothetical protein